MHAQCWLRLRSLPPRSATGSDSYLGVVGIIRTEEDAILGYATTLKATESPEAGFPPEKQKAYEEAYSPKDGPVVEMETAARGRSAMPATGCLSKGREAVYGSVKNYLELIALYNDLAGELYNGSGSVNQALQVAVPKYEQCMRSASYQITGLTAPQYAERKFGRYRVAERPNAEESALALTDYTCQQEAGLMTTIRDATATHMGAWLSTNEGRFQAIKEMVDAAKARAKKIIDG